MAGSIPTGEQKDFISKGKNQLILFDCRMLSILLVFYANINLFCRDPPKKIIYQKMFEKAKRSY